MSTCVAGLDEPHGDSVRSPPEAEALGRALAAPCRLARLRRRVIWTPSAGSPDDSGSGVQPGARQPDCRSRQIQFALGISRSVCRSVRRLSVCCIDRVNCCPDLGGLGAVLQRHDSRREEDRAARERTEVHHPGPGRVGPGEAGVGESDRGACDLANAGSSPVSWRTTEATGLSASAYQVAPVSVSASRDAIRPIRTAGRSPRRRQRH